MELLSYRMSALRDLSKYNMQIVEDYLAEVETMRIILNRIID